MSKAHLSRAALCCALFGLGFSNPAQAEPMKLKIGVLTDLSGPYSDFAGQGSVAATQMAVDDCLKAECKGMQIDVVSADHQNKADIALGIARKWFECGFRRSRPGIPIRSRPLIPI